MRSLFVLRFPHVKKEIVGRRPGHDVMSCDGPCLSMTGVAIVDSIVLRQYVRRNMFCHSRCFEPCPLSNNQLGLRKCSDGNCFLKQLATMRLLGQIFPHRKRHHCGPIKGSQRMRKEFTMGACLGIFFPCSAAICIARCSLAAILFLGQLGQLGHFPLQLRW